MTIAFIFPGQGSQTVGMGKEFYDNFSIARDVFLEVDNTLNQKLSQIIFEGSADDLTMTVNTQPALMAVSMAIVKTLVHELGTPLHSLVSHAAGHSLGEYTAHCAAETFSLADTAQLLRTRGQAMQDAVPQGKGAMAAILGLDLAVVEEICLDVSNDDSTCVVANDNCPGQLVISGHKNAVDRAILAATEKGAKRAIALAVSAPFHSPLMLPAAQAMKEALAMTPSQQPLVPIITNVSITPTQNLEECQSLLVEQVTGRVRWRESMANAQHYGISHVVEIGAGKVLSGMMKRIDDSIKVSVINTPADLDSFLKALTK